MSEQQTTRFHDMKNPRLSAVKNKSTINTRELPNLIRGLLEHNDFNLKK